jgi:hypothetical protein
LIREPWIKEQNHRYQAAKPLAVIIPYEDMSVALEGFKKSWSPSLSEACEPDVYQESKQLERS